MLSICMPAYKADRYLEPTLETIRQQTFGDWEVIVVEDGSKDRAEEMVRRFAATVKQSVQYLRHEKNQGLPATRNTGIGHASAEWIVLLDSDDLWRKDHLETLVECARQHPEAELVHAGSLLFDSDSGRELEVRAPSAATLQAFPRSLFTGEYIIQPSSVMLTKGLWMRAGKFDPRFRYVEDRDMWLRCARAGGKFAFTGQNTCLYRKHATALSTHSAPMAEAAAEVFDKHLDWELMPAELRKTLGAGAWESAGKLRQRSDPAVARRHFLRSCEIQWKLPIWARAQACGVLSLIKRPAT